MLHSKAARVIAVLAIAVIAGGVWWYVSTSGQPSYPPLVANQNGAAPTPAHFNQNLGQGIDGTTQSGFSGGAPSFLGQSHQDSSPLPGVTFEIRKVLNKDVATWHIKRSGGMIGELAITSSSPILSFPIATIVITDEKGNFRAVVEPGQYIITGKNTPGDINYPYLLFDGIQLEGSGVGKLSLIPSSGIIQVDQNKFTKISINITALVP